MWRAVVKKIVFKIKKDHLNNDYIHSVRIRWGRVSEKIFNSSRISFFTLSTLGLTYSLERLLSLGEEKKLFYLSNL